MIKTLDQMVEHVKEQKNRYKIAVAYAQDSNTIGAIAKAIDEGFVEAFMIGDEKKIIEVAKEEGVDPAIFNIIDIPGEVASVQKAVEMVRSDEADILMKGLCGTDKFLRGVIDKEKGLLPPKAIMSYVCALEIPKYHKLLFITDTAVLPFPDLKQKTAMLKYSVDMAHKFGITTPKVALISAAEKVSPHFESHNHYTQLSTMAKRGQIKDCIVDGPLDIFLACDKESVAIKGVPTPINGEADVLLFPSLEACNSFYKGQMLWSGAELAGLIQGTTKPVVVMSRSESPKSKYYCIALSCLMAEKQ
ncbi:MAG: phosphate acetyltransferase [Candidatus Cloacimonetes bacterium 4572_65]|nr:MAG: phosphate acetyltransferase [Candidatus Cloacimonetes bacterium 4572_65]